MRRSFLSSLVFALLASTSVAVTAAPAGPSTDTKPAVVATAAAEMAAKVNLNTANAETLQKELSGIGAGKAAAIVAHRDEHGEFTSVDELIEVKGIGKALLEKNRDRLSIN
ncbi:ComEA family DNA-binding protein [Pseudomonas sp. NPDC090202]|uniref:ComEA family DNA-binding protein n=1 Tax=unclassified Pseudomonas TaxID=196821 RepID=UPI003814D7C0